VAAAALAVLAWGCSRAPTRPAEIDEPPPATPPAPEPDRAPTADIALPDSAEASPLDEAQEILVDLDDEERQTLTSNAQRDLREAEQSIRDAERRVLSAENRETLATVEGLLAAARDAFAEHDIQAAATLAHKARLLASELTAN
jgi:hypothetical protein